MSTLESSPSLHAAVQGIIQQPLFKLLTAEQQKCLFDNAAVGNEVIDVGEGGVSLRGMIDNLQCNQRQ